MIVAPAAFISGTPALWSGCQWVSQTCEMCQPRASAAASNGAASPGSTQAHSCVSSSYTSQA